MIIFISCILFLVYIYFGYPCVIFVLSRMQRRKVRKASYEPHVSIIIAAYNEEQHIKDTLENKLALKYPKEKLEIIVISDGSQDRTDEIVRTFETHGVRLIRQEPRKGKTAALNLAVQKTDSEVLVFSDANSLYDQEALRLLMRNFADPQVGYVTGKMIYVNQDGTTIGDGCSAYMRYENLLRKLETEFGSVVGVDGGIDAVRRHLYRPMRADQLPDFVLPLSVLEQGYRVVYEQEALLKEDALKDADDEYRMRVRVSLRALWALWDKRGLLNPWYYGRFAFQLFSHKVLRYFAIIFIALAYVANALLVKRGLFLAGVFILQNLFYAAAAIGHRLERAGRLAGVLYIPYYFALINIAAGHALARFLMGEKQILWTPRKG